MIILKDIPLLKRHKNNVKATDRIINSYVHPCLHKSLYFVRLPLSFIAINITHYFVSCLDGWMCGMAHVRNHKRLLLNATTKYCVFIIYLEFSQP